MALPVNGVVTYESEVQKFIINHRNDEKRLNQSLFQLLSCYVGNRHHEEGDTERKFDLFQTIAAAFNNLLPSFRLI
jgi:hypothetical protein